jgi:hypothetical protein
VALALCVAPLAGAHDRARSGARVATAHRVASLSGRQLLGAEWAPSNTRRTGETPSLCGNECRQHGSGAVITPGKGKLLGETWAQLYSLPLSENPLVGNGNPCLNVGHKVIAAVHGGPCTVTQGTAIPIGFGSAWSNAEYPFPQDEAAQRAVALAADQGLAQIQVTVDGDDPVNTRRPRFEIFSPRRTVQLPAENILGVPAQTVTLTAHAWSGLVRNLRPGHHTIIAEVVWDGEPFSVTYVIDVVPRHDR